MDGAPRRAFLRLTAIAGTIGVAGCSQITGGDGVEDTDGDGVTDSEDYAPRDPAVQDADDVEPVESEQTESDEDPSEQTESGEQPSDGMMADWSARRPITIESQTEETLDAYPVVLTGVNTGSADTDSIRVVDERAETVIAYGVQSGATSGVDIAFQADIEAGETVDRYALYYDNSDATNEADNWKSVRYHWYDGFEQGSGSNPVNWTESSENPPERMASDCSAASDGSCSMYIDGQYVNEDSAVGNANSLPNRQYTRLEFDIRHVQDATQIRLTSENEVASQGGFDTTRIKFGEVDQFYTGDPVELTYDEWHTFRYEFTWEGDAVGWDLYIDDVEVDSVQPSRNEDVGTLAGVIYRQAAFGDGIHYIDDVKFLDSFESQLSYDVGDAESV